MTPEEKANNNILLVLQKLRHLELQGDNMNIKYEIGGLPMTFEDELTILDMLQEKKLLQITESYGNDSPI